MEIGVGLIMIILIISCKFCDFLKYWNFKKLYIYVEFDYKWYLS